MSSWLAGYPKAIVIVLPKANADKIQGLVSAFQDDRISIIEVQKADYRGQLTAAIQAVQTPLMALVDDDTLWGPRTLASLVAAFDDPSVGGVNVMIRLNPHISGGRHTLWESFGALNLVRRNILHSSLAYINHGQVLNLSGRTVAYRTEIFHHQDLYQELNNDYWLGTYKLVTGDDNFLTNWIWHRGWRTAFVNTMDAMIATTGNPDLTYLRQLIRWSRDTARSYLRDLAFALQHGSLRSMKRCSLNILYNYAFDFALSIEFWFLIYVTVCKLLHVDTLGHGQTR